MTGTLAFGGTGSSKDGTEAHTRQEGVIKASVPCSKGYKLCFIIMWPQTGGQKRRTEATGGNETTMGYNWK